MCRSSRRPPAPARRRTQPLPVALTWLGLLAELSCSGTLRSDAGARDDHQRSGTGIPTKTVRGGLRSAGFALLRFVLHMQIVKFTAQTVSS
jgi:hypothetical protein